MKVAVICPFWEQLHHVGSFRVRRMAKWLKTLGFDVVVVTAGMEDREYVHDGTSIVQVRDPLLRHRAAGVSRAPGNHSIREFSPIGRWLAKLASTLLVPDLSSFWMHRVMHDSEITERLQGVGLVVSSSPPESALVAARHIAVRLGCLFVTDLRDGWLDEPLKHQLENRLRSWLESRMERSVLDRSTAIIVTSDHWRRMLERRLPAVATKIHVIANAMPEGAAAFSAEPIPVPLGERMQLLYAGRLGGSRRDRCAAALLQPLLSALQGMGMPGTIRFLGDRDMDEYDDIRGFEGEFSMLGWDLEFESSVGRDAALLRMKSHQGLLLLSNSRGCIPAKLLDYLAARRPILAICPPDSAVSDIGGRYSQIFNVPVGSTDLQDVRLFLQACIIGEVRIDDPTEFSESVLEQRFNSLVRDIQV